MAVGVFEPSAGASSLSAAKLFSAKSMPVKSENLTSTGIDLAENSLAALRLDAPALGSNTPTAMMPLACTAREWLSPKAL